MCNIFYLFRVRLLCIFSAIFILLSETTFVLASPATTKNSSAMCKLCGQKYPDAKTLLRNRCPHNDGGKHVLFEGEAADKYICENCGMTYTSLKDLTRNTCPHENGAAHVPYRGGISAEYTCRWCGRKYKNLKDMTRTSCPKHPKKKGNHRPAGN